MLKNHVIEEIVDASMDKFSSEHDGSEGWSKEDITKMVKEHGGDNTDVLKAVALRELKKGVNGKYLKKTLFLLKILK